MAKVHDARIRANLERHAKIMNKLIIQGLSRIEASAEALRIMEEERCNELNTPTSTNQPGEKVPG